MIAALDFLRLATWNITAHTFLLSDYLTTDPGLWEPGKWLQYHGWRKKHFFIGTGEQKKKRHSIVNISGYDAQKEYLYLSGSNKYYATRIDIQVTIPKPNGMNLVEMYEDMRSNDVNCSVISSKTNDTLYVGSRTSPVFTRLYEKPLSKMFLRLEFEFKGNVAKGIWLALQAKNTPDEVFQHYLSRSKLPGYLTQHFFDAQDGAAAFATRKEIEHDDKKKLDWLRSCDESVRQAMYNHNIGRDVQELVMAWANEAANIDIIKEMD